MRSCVCFAANKRSLEPILRTISARNMPWPAGTCPSNLCCAKFASGCLTNLPPWSSNLESDKRPHCAEMRRARCHRKSGKNYGLHLKHPQLYGLVVVRPSTTCALSGPLRLRVQSRSRTRLRIAASIAFYFVLVLKSFRHYSTTIARLCPVSGLGWDGWELLPVGWDRVRQGPNRTPYCRGVPIAVEGVKQR